MFHIFHFKHLLTAINHSFELMTASLTRHPVRYSHCPTHTILLAFSHYPDMTSFRHWAHSPQFSWTAHVKLAKYTGTRSRKSGKNVLEISHCTVIEILKMSLELGNFKEHKILHIPHNHSRTYG